MYKSVDRPLTIVDSSSVKKKSSGRPPGMSDCSRLLELFFKDSHTCFALLDRDFNFIRVNQAYAQVDGRDVSDFPGRNHFELYPSDALAIFEQVRETKVPYETLACPFTYPDNPERGVTYWDWKLDPILGDSDEVELFVLSLADVTERKRAEIALAESEELFHTLANLSPVGVFYTDEEGSCVYVNEAWMQIAGMTQEQVLGTGWTKAIHPDDRSRVFNEWEQSVKDNREFKSECRFQKDNGDITWVLGQATPKVSIASGHGVFIGTITDINERKQHEEESKKLSSALAQTADSVMITNQDGVIEYVNQAFETITGFTRAEAIGQKPNLVRSGRHPQIFYKQLWGKILDGHVFHDVMINRRKSGELYYEEKTITPLKDSDGNVTSFISSGKDITERMQSQERLRHLVYHDALTELPNRSMFMERLNHALERKKREDFFLAVLFIDFDRFKYVNDSLGHDQGDSLLVELSRRLRFRVHQEDTLARFGGDEFAILIECVEHPEDVADIAKDLLEVSQAAINIGGYELHVTASIGISIYPEDAKDSAALIMNADAAMYRAKNKGGNTFQYYSQEIGVSARQHLQFEAYLHSALDNNEFEIHYQPQFDIETNRVTGVEALARWNNQELGAVSPLQFIPVLEETGLIIVVGEWILHKACQTIVRLNREFELDLLLSVNISSWQFSNSQLAATVERVLSETGLSPKLLELELTETVFMKHDDVSLDNMRRLHALGVRFALDDFGTGYSSLSYLKRFHVDTLKIDRSFIIDMLDREDSANIVAGLIGLAHSIRLKVVAEGVEHEEQRALLEQQQCDAIQGFLFSKPLEEAKLAELLKQYQAE